MLVYRKATDNDIENLVKFRSICLQEINDICSEDERQKVEIANQIYFQSAFADDSFVAWFAVDDGNIVGTSGLSFYLVPPNAKCPDGKVAYIMNMFTLPARRQGIGAELFQRIVKEAIERGYKKITLNATGMGRLLYEKHGFKNSLDGMIFYAE